MCHQAFHAEALCKKKKLIFQLKATYRSQVRIGILRVQTAVVLDVLESLVHQAAVAALVALRSGAIHQVLLTQRHQLPALSVVLTLQGSGGAEGPAGATLTLVATERKGHPVRTKAMSRGSTGTTVFTPARPRSH